MVGNSTFFGILVQNNYLTSLIFFSDLSGFVPNIVISEKAHIVHVDLQSAKLRKKKKKKKKKRKKYKFPQIGS